MATSTQRNPYVWNLAVCCSAVHLKQAVPRFPLTSTSTQSLIVTINKGLLATGLGLTLYPPPVADWWSWEFVCLPVLLSVYDRPELNVLYGTNGVKMAEYLYGLLYSKLVALGRLPPETA